MDQGDAQAGAVRADVEETGQLAHLIDLDLEARPAAARGSVALLLLLRRGVGLRGQGFRLEAAEVGMVAAGVPATAFAGAARLARRVLGFAKKELGDPLGERQLADALRAMNQQRVRTAYLARAKAEPARIRVIDASEEVVAVRQAVETHLADL